VPPLVSTDTVAVLNDRIVYAAYAVDDAGVFSNQYQLEVIDTSTPSMPSDLGGTPLASYPPGLVGTRNPSAAGGTVNMLHIDSTQCEGDGSAAACELDMIHVTVPTNGTPVIGKAVVIGAVPATQGTEGCTSYINGGPEDVVIFPAVNGTSASVALFSNTSSLPNGTPIPFPIQSEFLKAPVVSECYAMAFAVGVPVDTRVFGVPLTSGASPTILTADLGHAAAAVRFEPYTSTLIAPFRSGSSFALLAYSLTGTPMANATLTARLAPGWNPPADLEPNFVGVREPIPFTSCPSP
jgi:hypothetical protein